MRILLSHSKFTHACGQANDPDLGGRLGDEHRALEPPNNMAVAGVLFQIKKEAKNVNRRKQSSVTP